MRHIKLILATATLGLAPIPPVHGGAEVWTITQISDGFGGARPSLRGERVAWHVANAGLIMLYDNGVLSTVADTPGFPNVSPKVGDGIVAWAMGGDVYIHDGTEVIQVTNDGDTVLDYEPDVFGADVVWQRGFPVSDVMTWNGRAMVPLLASTCDELDPRTSQGHLVWRQIGSSNCGGFTGELFFRDGSTGGTTRVTDNDLTEIHFNHAGRHVAWRHSSNPEIYTWDADGGVITELSTSAAFFGAPAFAGTRVAWPDWDGTDYEVMVYDRGVTTTLTDNDVHEGLVVGSEELVAWLEPDEDDPFAGHIIAWNGATQVRVTTEPRSVSAMEVDGSTIMFGASGHIFLAQLEFISADADNDGVVGVNDLITIILNWGPCPGSPTPCPADLDGDGVVGVGDLELVILGWD